MTDFTICTDTLMFGKQVFSDEFCNNIITWGEEYEIQDGVDYALGPKNPEEMATFRHNSPISWMNDPEHLAYIRLAVRPIVESVNIQMAWDLELNKEYLFEIPQYTMYTSGGLYDWHGDFGIGGDENSYQRAFTCVILLADQEKDFTGGDFLVKDAAGNIVKSPAAKKGDAVFFTPTTLHRVDEILSGVRKSLVLWCHGRVKESRSKMGIVVLCNEKRSQYLQPFLESTLPYLEENLGHIGEDYELIISQQTNYKDPFNFNMTVNIGFRYAFEKLGCTHVLWHGVDNIPISGVNYSWPGKVETGFMVFGGFKCDPQSYYKSQGPNNFMYGWGWQDMEFYDRLRFYNISFEEWFYKEEAINSVVLDMSNCSEPAEAHSVRKWAQGRPNLTGKDVPSIRGLCELQNDNKLPRRMEMLLDESYNTAGWCHTVYLRGNQALTQIVAAASDTARDIYYRKSGYKTLDLGTVVPNRIKNTFAGTADIHNAQFCTWTAFPQGSDFE